MSYELVCGRVRGQGRDTSDSDAPKAAKGGQHTHSHAPTHNS